MLFIVASRLKASNSRAVFGWKFSDSSEYRKVSQACYWAADLREGNKWLKMTVPKSLVIFKSNILPCAEDKYESCVSPTQLVNHEVLSWV